MIPINFWRGCFLVEEVLKGVLGELCPALCPTKSSRRLVSLHCVACLSHFYTIHPWANSGAQEVAEEKRRADVQTPGPQPAAYTGTFVSSMS